jgi:hypothetical protein
VKAVLVFNIQLYKFFGIALVIFLEKICNN